MESSKHATRVDARLLAHRLDAAYYAPHHLRREQRLSELGVLRAPLGSHAELITDGTHQTPTYVANGFPFLSAANIEGAGINFTGHKCVSQSEFEKLRAWNCVPVAGDVLVAKSGSIGNTAVVPAEAPPFAIFESLAIVRSAKYDPYYLAMFLASSSGQDEIRRHTKGSVIKHLHLEDLREVEIPEFDERAQKYIGSKVRQAETLRSRANSLTADAREFFSSVHSGTEARRKGAWRRSSAQLSEFRLDASFYNPMAVELVARLTDEGADTLGCYTTLVKASFDPNQPIHYFEIGGVDVATGCAVAEVIAPGAAPSRAQRLAMPWDILVATVRPERKNVAIVPAREGQLVASSGFSVLRAACPELASFLWCYLRSDAATEQLLRWNTGAAFPAIDDEVPLDILIPSYGEGIVSECGGRWMKIPELVSASSALVFAARLLVEALIERKLTETELAVALNDPESDRALLSRLTDKGLDGGGTALFPDLTSLSALLSEGTGDNL